MLRKKVLSVLLTGLTIALALCACSGDTVVPEGSEAGINGAASEAEEMTEDAATGYGAGEWRTYDPAISATFGMGHDINSDAFTAMANAGNHMITIGGSKCSAMKSG